MIGICGGNLYVSESSGIALAMGLKTMELERSAMYITLCIHLPRFCITIERGMFV